MLGDILYAFEVMDKESMDLVVQQNITSKHEISAVNPFQGRSFPFYVLIETGSRDSPFGEQRTEDGQRKNDPDLDKLFGLFEHAGDCIIDGVVAQDMKQFKQIWYLREQVAPAGVQYGYCLKYDVSLQPRDYYNCVEATRNIISQASSLSQEEKDSIVTVGYGHIGDGNLHLNCSLPGYENEDLQ